MWSPKEVFGAREEVDLENTVTKRDVWCPRRGSFGEYGHPKEVSGPEISK